MPRYLMTVEKKEALKKAMQYCVYQERAPVEVEKKLRALGQPERVIKELLRELKKENFLNEARFARLFVSGKFRLRQWGRLKIQNGLREKGISENLIEKGLSTEIKNQEYQKTLKELISKKQKVINEKDAFKKTRKLANYLTNKGYEPEIFWKLLKR